MARRATSKRSRLRWLTAGDRPFVFALIGLLVVLLASALGPVQRLSEMADRVDALEVTRDTLEDEVERLEDRREQLEDPEQVEILARQELGLVKEGEVPFVVVTPEPEVDQLGPETPEDPDTDASWYQRLGRVLSDWFE